MKWLDNIGERFKQRPTDVLGADVASSSLKLIRARKQNNTVTLLAADMLPAVRVPSLESDGTPPPRGLALPKNLKARYVSLAVTGEGSIIKLLTFPGHFDHGAESQIGEHMGLENPAGYRVGYRLISETRNESRVLAVAVPESAARGAAMLFPVGLPAPYSLEISCLAALSGFINRQADAQADSACGFIDFGAHVSLMAFFNRGVLCLVRKLEIGSEQILRRICGNLSVDSGTAEQILSGGSFDVSQCVKEVMDPFIKQMVISRDFVERREECRIGKVYVCGGVVHSDNWMDQIRTALAVAVIPWNPLEGIPTAPGAIPASLGGQEHRFAAAIGAALATLEEA